ncbi:MAG: serine hydrolase [Hyphomonadaceae bacterium]
MRVIAALGAFVVALSAGACAAPAALADDLPTCAAASAYSAARNGVSVLVLRNGEVVCEAYANGAGAADAHELWSGTKSFNGVMAAIAVRDGLLTLDEPVSDTLTEWRGDPQRRG